MALTDDGTTTSPAKLARSATIDGWLEELSRLPAHRLPRPAADAVEIARAEDEARLDSARRPTSRRCPSVETSAAVLRENPAAPTGAEADPERGMPMRPTELVRSWVDAFNRADVDALVAMYSEDAVNHQVAEEPVQGREALRRMFTAGFQQAEMVCVVENLFEDGEWAILEWSDPLGLRGCGFFHVVDGKIVFQRGYWDKLSFLRAQGLPLPEQP
jgi:limonene-1,2-epoxide hydrolase